VLSIPKIGFRCMISEESQKITTNKTLNDVTGKNRSFEELRSYIQLYNPSKSIVKVMKNQSGTFGTSKLQTLRAIVKFLISDNKNIKTNYNYYGRTKIRVFFYTINSILKKKYREYFMKRNLATKVDCDIKFVYFPLGVDMERNLLIAAPFFTNQIEIIRHVAKSLPVGYDLYVKESPAAATRSWQSIADYKKIMEIPNVTLIHPKIDSENLVKHCSLVVTVGGSTGFQAAFYEKSSIIFSDTVYSILPSVQQIKNLEELPKAVRLGLQMKVNNSDLDKYITLLDEQSFEIDLYEYQNKFANTFYYNSWLVDTEIHEQTLKLFMESNESTLSKLSLEYSKKIKEFKMSKIQGA